MRTAPQKTDTFMLRPMLRRGLPLLLVAVTAAAVLVTGTRIVTAQGQPAPARTTPATDIPAIPFEKYTLPNGLEVILSQSRALPLVSVNVWYHVGPANEEPGRTGFAHLFEHMMFQGSKHVPGDLHFKTLEGAGASGVNGTTGFDRTNYFETLPSNQLELGLWLESDRMGYLLDKVDQANLSNQQDVVRNERRQSYENRPYGIVDEALFHTIFPKGHPYYASVIGSHADIQAAKLDDVKAFFRKYYAPNNATIAIVGDFETAAAKRLIEKYFGTLKRGAAVAKPSVVTPPITAERRVTVTDRVELPRVTMAWLTPPMYKAGDAEADVAGAVLGGGKTSRLYKALVYDRQIAQSVSAQQQSMMLTSVFQVEALARPGHTADELAAAIDEELAKFRAEGPTAAELDQARNGIEAGTLQRLEHLGGFGGVADLLNSYNHYLGDPGYLQQDLGRYRALSPAAVRAFAQQYLSKDARVVVYGVPGEQNLGPAVPAEPVQAAGGAESVNADEPWRATAPTPAAAPALALPVPTLFTLPNGLTVYVANRPDAKVISASLVVKTGSGANPAGAPGLASFTSGMLDEGTTTRTSPQIADAVATLGGSLSTGASTDASQVSITALPRTFPQMLDLMADVVRHPSFPEEEVKRQQGSRLAQLVQQRGNANAVATAVMFAALYGNAHPYGYTDLGTDASNRAVTAADARAFWKAYYTPDNAALVVAGRITVAELRPLVEKALGDWAKGASAPPAISAPSPVAQRLLIVDRPGAPQTQLRVASLGVARSSPDYPALRVMNETLGGLFSSRINLNLREEHGYTYGASSQFVFRREAGPFLVATGVRTDVTSAALTEVFKELRRMQEAPVTPDELALAKDSFVRSLPAEFETSAAVAGTMANLFIYGLDLRYYATLPATIAGITAAQVQDVARRHLRPDTALVVAVGDRAKIEPGLAALSLGSPAAWTTDATPVAH